MIVFGGVDSINGTVNDTWALDFSTSKSGVSPSNGSSGRPPAPGSGVA
jgi:hypothetical protein